MNISIVLPAYNEEQNIKNTIISISNYIKDLNINNYEILVVNDGSRDKTGEIVRNLCSSIDNLKLVEHYPNRGYGGALKAGFSASKMDWIFFMDSDGQFDFKEMGLLIDKEKETKADIIAGYRKNRNDKFIRKFNAFGWWSVVTILFGYLVKDIDCAFKLFKKKILDDVILYSDGAMINTEFLAGAKRRGYKIIEVPVSHYPRKEGVPTGANIKVILKAFRDLVVFKFKLLKQK